MHQFLLEFFTSAKGDVVYAALLMLSAFIALVFRQNHILQLHQKLDGLIGVSIVFIVSGWMTLCSFILVLSHVIILRFVRQPSLLTKISFYGTFVYLAILRCMHLIGLPRLEFVTNAIQLILTLRAIGLSYEISDLRQRKKSTQEQRVYNRTMFIEREPSIFEAFNYLFSFIGLFTGPYYTYRTYSDALNHSQKPLAWSKLRPMLYTKMRTLMWSLPAFVFMTWLNPVNDIRGDKLSHVRLFTLFIYCALAFVYLRMRIYSAWMVAESICLLSGIGIYPTQAAAEAGRGPSHLETTKLSEIDWNDPSTEFDAETINNLDIPHVEHSDGFRSGMRSWNRTVQFWLAYFVYQRSNRKIRMFYTMLVSAFWHGVHPGYFFSFLTIPLCTAAENCLFKAFPLDDRPQWIQKIWSFIRMRGFELMASGFLLLDGHDTLRLWSKMYFWLHFTMIGTIVLLRLYVRQGNVQKVST